MPESKNSLTELASLFQGIKPGKKSTKAPKEILVSEAVEVPSESPSDAVQAEFRAVAKAAVEAEDARREATVKAAIAKASLFNLMNTYKIKQIQIPGRAPAKIISEDKKSLTLKALKSVLGDEKGLEVWNKLPITPGRESLRIPAPPGDEGASEE